MLRPYPQSLVNGLPRVGGCVAGRTRTPLLSASAAADDSSSTPKSPQSALKKLALSQAALAASDIVQTNRLLDPNICKDGSCKSDEEIAGKRALLPPQTRNQLARTRLWAAKRALAFADSLDGLASRAPPILTQHVAMRYAVVLAAALLVICAVAAVCSSMTSFGGFLPAVGLPGWRLPTLFERYSDGAVLTNGARLRLFVIDFCFEWD